MSTLLLTLVLALLPVVDQPAADANAPIVIGLHGRGDTPENFRSVAERLGPQLHWQFPRGPLQWKPDAPGAQWFDRQSPDGGKAALQAALALVAAQVAKAGKKPVALVGFSQGCMVAAHYVAAHPDQVRAALCFGGMLIAPVQVPRGRHAVQIRFVHGTHDPMVPYANAQEAVAVLRKAGLDATLTTHEGGHVIPQQLTAELKTWIASRLH